LAPCAFYPDYPKLASGSRIESEKMTDNSSIRVADLPQNQPTPFDLRPDQARIGNLVRDLDLIGLRKLRFQGQLAPSGKRDWLLTARLGATVVQPCVVTLEPVTTRLDLDVRRQFLANFDHPAEEEVEMHEDDSIEPLGAFIDPALVMAEALALALPLYPRAEGAELGEAVFTKPGKKPMRDEDARPFASLSGLRDSLKNGDDDS
jgi:uncharacterized metal-binding protein YceD (DUF177 family)